MVDIHLYAFWGLLQLLLLALVVAGFLYWRSRRAGRALKESRQHAHELEERPDVGHYFTTELKLTEGRLSTVSMGQGFDSDALRWLRFRLDYLALERDCAAMAERDDKFWEELEPREQRLLRDYTVVETPPREADEEETPQMADLLHEQVELLDLLRTEIKERISDPAEARAMFEQLDRMGRLSGELTVCARMLMEENELMRDQTTDQDSE